MLVPFSDSDVVAAFPDLSVGTPPVGKGGHKVVYSLTDSDPRAVLKILMVSKADADDEAADDIAARFEREVEALKLLNSPNIVRVFRGPESRAIAGREYPWYLEERLDGGSLSSRTKAGSLTEAEAMDLLRQLLSAVGDLWSAGYVHRDIKPDNIMFEGDRVVLVDLGVAFHLDGDDITGTLDLAPGTWKYAAPEQFVPRRKTPLDHRTDQFLAALSVYEAFTGLHPFDAHHGGRSGYAQRLNTPLDQARLDLLPDGLRNVLSRMLDPRVSRRFRSVDLARKEMED